MIVSGRHFSRAWLAVAGAASDDPDRAMFYRAVRVEEHREGVRLVATDSYWLAQCWAPRADLMADLGHTEPDTGELPDRAVTIRDDEHRVRDLMRHVAKATKKADAEDIEIRIDLTASMYDDARPTLTPEMAERRVRLEVPDERLLARIVDTDEWVDWRALDRAFAAAERTGVVVTALSGWMLTALGKVAAVASCVTVGIDWIDEGRAVWRGLDSSLDFVPHGLFMAVRRDRPGVDPDQASIDDEQEESA